MLHYIELSALAQTLTQADVIVQNFFPHINSIPHELMQGGSKHRTQE